MGAFLAIGQQFTGINAVIVYATKIFVDYFDNINTDVALNENYSSTYGSLIISSVNFVATIFAIPLVNKAGRKLLVMIGFSIDLAAIIMLVVIYIINNNDPNKATLITASVIFLIGFELGPGLCFYVCCTESFPTAV